MNVLDAMELWTTGAASLVTLAGGLWLGWAVREAMRGGRWWL